MIIKWMSETPNADLLISEDQKHVFLLSNGITELIPEHHNGRSCYRIPKTSTRIGKRTIKKHSKRVDVII